MKPVMRYPRGAVDSVACLEWDLWDDGSDVCVPAGTEALLLSEKGSAKEDRSRQRLMGKTSRLNTRPPGDCSVDSSGDQAPDRATFRRARQWETTRSVTTGLVWGKPA